MYQIKIHRTTQNKKTYTKIQSNFSLTASDPLRICARRQRRRDSGGAREQWRRSRGHLSVQSRGINPAGPEARTAGLKESGATRGAGPSGRRKPPAPRHKSRGGPAAPARRGGCSSFFPDSGSRGPGRLFGNFRGGRCRPITSRGHLRSSPSSRLMEA